jgi:hypothetical protein
MATKLNDFLTKIGEGVKPNMFAVDINWPQTLANAPKSDDLNLVNLLCKSAALPASNLGVIEVPFRGRTVKIAGDRTFDTWSATFFNDREFKLRAYFEKWLEQINTHETNNSPLFKPNNSEGYMATLGVKQLRKDNTESGSVLRQYDLLHAFPTSVSQIDLAYDSNDQIEEFTVEFQYSYWKAVDPASSEITSGASTNPGGSSIRIEA